MDYVLNLNALLAHLIANHPKHKAVEDKLSRAKEIVIPGILIIELQWVVLSKRHPEISEEVFAETMEAIKTDALVRLEAVTPEVANEQMKWYNKLSFFDAYYAAFSIVHKKRLLTTDRGFKLYNFAEVV